MAQREAWTSRLGFVLAAVGSAVGLGNIWQFPFRTGQNGGAAFLVVYLVVVFLIGFPTMLAEFVVGRRSRRNPVDAFRELGHGAWVVVGALGTFVAFWILSFYSVVGGWVIRYLLDSLTGAYFGNPQTYFFGTVASGTDALAFHALFLALSVIIVAFGVEGGIERSTKLMVPGIIVLLVGLAIWGATLDGASAAYAYYLSPDFGALAANVDSVLPAAVGQAFFTLSLGMGAMITYSSYIGTDDDLPFDGGSIVVVNTLVGVLAGFVVFPVLFAIGVTPERSGLGAAFISLAGAFGALPLGRLLGALFFFVLLLAALSSAISLLEVMTSYLVDNTRFPRWQLTAGLGVAVFALGIPSAYSIDVLGWFNDLAYNLFLPLSVLLLTLFVGWVYAGDSVDELRQGAGVSGWFYAAWLWVLRTLVPLGVLLTLYLGVVSLLGKAGVL